jgi:hypothetical protein
MFRPKTPHPDTILLKKLTSSVLDLKKSMDTDETHTTQKEGVYYQLQEHPKSTKRLMGFREWCEKH